MEVNSGKSIHHSLSGRIHYQKSHENTNTKHCFQTEVIEMGELNEDSGNFICASLELKSDYERMS